MRSKVFYHQRAGELEAIMSPLADRVTLWPAYWIETPKGEAAARHGGSDWCGDCASALVRHLRRHAFRKQREEVRLSGGYRTDHDHMLWCASCGRPLDGSLTTYGAHEEVDHFMWRGVTPGSSLDALSIYLILEATVHHTADKLELVEAAADLAEAFLWAAT